MPSRFAGYDDHLLNTLMYIGSVTAGWTARGIFGRLPMRFGSISKRNVTIPSTQSISNDSLW